MVGFWRLLSRTATVSPDFSEYDGSGSYLTYLSGEPESTEDNLARIRKIYDDVNKNGIREDELEQAKNKVS